MDLLRNLLDAFLAFIDTNQDLIVAVATVILAYLTWNMARSTKAMAIQTQRSVDVSNRMVTTAIDQSRAASDQVQLTRQALHSSVQPLLMDVTGRGAQFDLESEDFSDIIVTEAGETTHIRLSFLNVGAGAALIERAAARRGFESVTTEATDISRKVVRPDGSTRLSFSLPSNSTRGGGKPSDHHDYFVEVSYRNVLGEHPTKTRVHLAKDTDLYGQTEYCVTNLWIQVEGQPQFHAKTRVRG